MFKYEVYGPDAADWLDEWFEDDLLKAGLARTAVDGCYAGPRSPATTTNLLWTECTVAARVILG